MSLRDWLPGKTIYHVCGKCGCLLLDKHYGVETSYKDKHYAWHAAQEGK